MTRRYKKKDGYVWGRDWECFFSPLSSLTQQLLRSRASWRRLNLHFSRINYFPFTGLFLRVWIRSLFKNKSSHLQALKVEVKIKYTDNVDIPNYLQSSNHRALENEQRSLFPLSHSWRITCIRQLKDYLQSIFSDHLAILSSNWTKSDVVSQDSQSI